MDLRSSVNFPQAFQPGDLVEVIVTPTMGNIRRQPECAWVRPGVRGTIIGYDDECYNRDIGTMSRYWSVDFGSSVVYSCSEVALRKIPPDPPCEATFDWQALKRRETA